jgi:hypothetical protein
VEAPWLYLLPSHFYHANSKTLCWILRNIFSRKYYKNTLKMLRFHMLLKNRNNDLNKSSTYNIHLLIFCQHARTISKATKLFQLLNDINHFVMQPTFFASSVSIEIVWIWYQPSPPPTQRSLRRLRPVWAVVVTPLVLTLS